MRKTIVLFVLLAAVSGHAEDMLLRIKDKADELAAAFIKKEIEAIADLTHPKVLDALGGRAKAVSEMRKAMEGTMARIKPKSIVLAAPASTISAGAGLFAIVPATHQYEAPNGTIDVKGFLLAVSEDTGKTWTFIDGAGLTSEMMVRWFPDAAGKVKLPEKEKPVFKKNPAEPQTLP